MDNENMKRKSLSLHAWDYMLSDAAELILEGGYSEIYFYWPLEWEWSLPPEIYEHIKKNNIMIYIITCGMDKRWLYRKVIKEGFSQNLVKVETWPMFWFLRTHNSFFDENNQLYHNIDVSKFDFKHPFLTYNGRHCDHRTRLIDMLYHNNYLDKGVVTYHQTFKHPNDIIKWNFYHGAPILNDDGYDSHRSSYRFNQKFLDSFLHIPTESTLSTAIISEKTAIPILCRLPFLTLGPQHYHKQLKDLGFELYDEIFDYSFDDEPDDYIRIDKLLKNVQFVIDNSYRLNDLYQIILPKIMRNYELVMRHITSYSLLPQMIKDRFKQYSSPDVQITTGDMEYIKIANYFTDKRVVAPSAPVSVLKVHFDLWHNFSYDEVISAVTYNRVHKVVILGENEWDPWITKEAVAALNASNTLLVYQTGSPDRDRAYKQLKDAGVKNLKVTTWPTFWINYSDQSITHDWIRPPDTGKFKYPFICLNNRGHLHRAHVIDQLAKEDLLDKGVVTWHDFLNETVNFEFKYFDRQVIKIDDDFDIKLDSFLIPKEFHESLFHCVTECCHETIMFSEKTAIPIMAKKPFVAIGGCNYNKFLQDLGFELYDEIIDYSFDSVEDVGERARLFVQNVKRLSKLTNLTEIYELLKPKIQRNYENFYRIRDDINYFPEEVRTIINSTPDVENLYATPSQRKYAELIKRMRGNR
jgi:hypothetical protein